MSSLYAENTTVCVACLKPLTYEEWYYYESRCEQCEGAWHKRITEWRHGKEDAELDKLYDGALAQEGVKP